MSSFQATALQRSVPFRFILKRELQMMKSTENTITESTHFQARHVNQAAGENMILHPSSPKREYLSNKQDDKLQSAKAEMGEVRQENKNLKRTISEIMKEYKCLQMNFLDIFEQEVPKKSVESDSTNKGDEETEFVSLTLGRSSTHSSTHSSTRGDKKKGNNSCCGKEQSKFDQALELGLDCRFDPSPTMKNPSPGKSNDDMEEDQENNEKWLPSKSLKSAKTDDNDILQQTPLKKARVSIRAICNAPTMNDGCQWRKYGQKIAKGNPCPRAYYRCTVSPSCPVRKHVQRCAEDRSILVTTYEGTHNHQLPVSATVMASTNSAAASMFKSNSSTSNITNATTFANLHGLNYNSKVPQYSFNFPTTTFSTTQSHPTITLDLTVPTTSSHFNKSSSNFLPSAPRFPPKCLNFASPFSSSSYISNLGRQTIKESYYQSNFMNRNNFQSSSQQPSAETISAAAKALTSNPTFQSALVSAITSFVGKGRSGVQENHVGGENSGHINLGYS